MRRELEDFEYAQYPETTLSMSHGGQEADKVDYREDPTCIVV